MEGYKTGVRDAMRDPIYEVILVDRHFKRFD